MKRSGADGGCGDDVALGSGQGDRDVRLPVGFPLRVDSIHKHETSRLRMHIVVFMVLQPWSHQLSWNRRCPYIERTVHLKIARCVLRDVQVWRRTVTAQSMR